MAKAKRIQKQLFYKHACFLNPGALTLQDLFHKAILALPITQRDESVAAGGIPSGNSWVRLINSPRVYSGFNFGVMVLYSPGYHHMVIDLAAAEGKDELDVSKLPAPAGKQFMETPLYFAIRDNHIALIQSKALRAADLENHLNWLCTTAGAIDGGQRIELSDAIPEVTRKRIEKEPVKSIRIGVPLVDSPAESTIGDKVSSAVSRAASGLGLSALRGLLSESEYAGLKLEDLTETPDIEVNVEIKVTGRRRKAANDDKLGKVEAAEHELMSSLMRELRHVEDVSFLQVRTKGGGRLDGNDLRVQNEKTIASYDGVLDTSDAFETMRKWLESLVDSGAVAING
ncbi:hypothetical protein AWB81_03974 [Caballeronia arationis]|uniref:hypothetical protein n=1 Tax=Caballeronia arationis TaxID=1777142 RepID=UPI00074B46A9|nr:hypothetical protein [Caballeronia arationis]SAK80562.1 hypothetical protein AWB81_03974 [Caballeronia arationis]